MTRRQYIIVPLFVLVLAVWAVSTVAGPPPPKPPAASDATPPQFAKGEELFNDYCAKCHGIKAVGTTRGPSFIDKIYEPSHHGDSAFYLAARKGVRAHHWSFGNMPPVHDVTPAQVELIIGYVRWLQRQAGIS